jgi:hypothetical protein
VFAPGQPFQPSPLFVGKATSVPLSGAPGSCLTWIGSCLTCKHYRQEESPVSENVLKAKSPNLPNWTVNKIFIVLFTIKL